MSNIPKPERIKLENTERPIEDIIYEKRDTLYPKLLEIIRYCEKNEGSNITFLEIEKGDTLLTLNVTDPYDEQILNCINYYEGIEEYEICQELKSYLT